MALVSLSISAQNNSNKASMKFNEVMYYIDRLYLDTVNFSNLVDEAIKASISQLDPHSDFVASDDVQAMNEPLEAEFDGIGIEFSIISDTLTVQAPISGGPSESVGMRAGDKIIYVDDEKIAGTNLTNERVYKYLRGPKGSRVKIKVKRRGINELLEFSIVRDKIPINSVDGYYSIDDVLYIRLSRFAATSHEEIRKLIQEDNNKGLILDLRGNSGGYLMAAIEIANEFLNAGDLIVYTEGRKIPPMKEYATGKGIAKEKPLVILIDEHSASASEIVAGAIQDWDRGLIIGRRSFGKGLVQQGIPLSDGSELRLTIARYHTPSGRVIQSPYEEGEKEDYYLNFYKRFSNGESLNRDSINIPDSLKYKTLRLKRTVYGGGGILPDIFIPQDTSNYTSYYGNILRQGIIPEYVNDLVDIKREDWKKAYPNFEKFNAEFKISDEYFEELLKYAETKGVKRNEKEITTSRHKMEIYIKALVGSAIIDRNTFHRILNSDDDEYLKKSLEVLKNWDESKIKYLK